MDTTIDYFDQCRGCGAGFSHRYGAFLCGSPLGDCPAAVEAMEAAMADDEEAAVAEAFALLAPGLARDLAEFEHALRRGC